MAMNKTDQGHDKGHQQNFPGQGNPGQGDKSNRQDDPRKQNQNPNQGGQYNQGRPGDHSDKGGDRGNQPNR